ncbi:MAG: Radical SAM superfamily enzyme [Candidatus Methanohalarchaeum thermophilum]|uniref:Radical SAM superfamily enzyme n=1 Tax=Methanohalarchaeum thermophilum TaxID=1903181 RepID=A0A1Q6DUL9_METT1|nr:MAG: Radical SAM superfamily enzyme [Candidatus Methanohalarchaeum thermophilum]
MKEISVLDKKGLDLFLEIGDNDVKLRSSGPFSIFAKPIVSKVNWLLENEKPIRVSEDQVTLSTWIPPIPSEPFKRAIKAEIKSRIFNENIPEAVSMNISACTLNCEECNILGEGSQLETKLIKDFMDEVQEMGAISLGFAEGDPLLRDDLFELIEHVDKDKSTVSVFTPGPLMDDETASKLKEKGVHSVITGIKSPIPSEHNKARGKKRAFQDAINCMETCVDKGLNVSMHTHVKPSLVEEGKITEIYELAKKTDVHELTLWESHPTWSYKDKTSLILSESHRNKLTKLYKKWNKTEGPRIFYNHVFESEDMFGCMAGKRWLNLIHDGTLTPCTYVPISFGNIKEEKVETIWQRMQESDAIQCGEKCKMLDEEFRTKVVDKHSVQEMPIDYRNISW